MISNLTRLPREEELAGIKIKRAFAGEKMRVMDFIRQNFSEGWVYEAENALMQHKCFIATKEGRILGFACYDATAKGYFGPIGVLEETRGQGVGTALLLRTLTCMKEEGYGYAVIGWVDDAELFYRKTVNAEWIPGGEPENTVYSNLIDL
jgi:GNAT superfamily N-acetyltransferase